MIYAGLLTLLKMCYHTETITEKKNDKQILINHKEDDIHVARITSGNNCSNFEQYGDPLLFR